MPKVMCREPDQARNLDATAMQHDDDEIIPASGMRSGKLIVTQAGRLACACPKVLFVCRSSACGNGERKNLWTGHERRGRQSPMIVEGNRTEGRWETAASSGGGAEAPA